MFGFEVEIFVFFTDWAKRMRIKKIYFWAILVSQQGKWPSQYSNQFSHCWDILIHRMRISRSSIKKWLETMGRNNDCIRIDIRVEFLAGWIGGGDLMVRYRLVQWNSAVLRTWMRRVVQRLELEHCLEALVRPLGVSNKLDVQIWSCTKYFDAGSLIAQQGDSGAVWVSSIVYPDQICSIYATGTKRHILLSNESSCR